jgi:hypothetical protein
MYSRQEKVMTFKTKKKIARASKKKLEVKYHIYLSFIFMRIIIFLFENLNGISYSFSVY